MKSKLERIFFLLNEVYKNLNDISEENFDKTMSRVRNLLSESQKHKTFLLKNFSKAELMKFEPYLTNLTKQIKESFDNISENKKLEIEKVRLQIQYTQNRKKLVNYIR